MNNIKRNIYILFSLCLNFSLAFSTQYSFVKLIQRWESLNTKFSFWVSLFFYRIVFLKIMGKQNKQLIVSDKEEKEIFTFFSNRNVFLEHNVIVLKSYVSDKEKGVLMFNYSEIVNAIPVLFDLKKLSSK